MRIRKLTLATAVATATLTANQAMAQGDLFVEEILVTARKQTETLQDVPLSLTAFGAAEIETQAIETTEDVIKLSPGLTFTRGIGGQDLRPDIRGLTPLSGRANIAILVDGVDITTDSLVGTGAGQLVSLGLFDLERVEVVRGPQSALFGRNAFGGAINYITKKPSASFEGALSLELAEWGTRKAKLGLSGPLSDSILYRLNLSTSRTDGEYENFAGTKLGDDDTQSVSLAVQFLPTDSLEILTRLDYSDQDSGQKPVGRMGANACFEEDQTDTTSAVKSVNGVPVDVKDCRTSLGVAGAGARYAGTLTSFDEDMIELSDDDRFGTQTELLQWTTLINFEITPDWVLSNNIAYTKLEGSDAFDLDHGPDVIEVGDCQLSPPGAPFCPPNGPGTGPGRFQLSGVVFPWVDANNPFSYLSDRDYEREAIFEDLRISYDALGSVRALAGIEVFKETYQQDDYSRANSRVLVDRSPTTLPITGTTIPIAYGVYANSITWSGQPIVTKRDTTSWSVYGNIDWEFVDSWELSLSGRYQVDRFRINYGNGVGSNVTPSLPYDVATCNANGGTDPNVGCFEPGANPLVAPETNANARFYAFNPRVVLTWYTTDDVMLYASVAKGTKPGGHTVQPDISTAPGADPNILNYEQERLTSYEFGWKTSWLSDRLVANGALFYMENKDKQANNREYVTFSGTPQSYVDNIGETKVQGLELQLTGVITSFWKASLNYAWIDTEIVEFLNASAYGIPSPPSNLDPVAAREFALADPDADQSGNELPYTPEHNIQLTNQFDFTLSDSLDMFVRIDGTYNSERWLTADNYSKINDFTVWDLKVGLRHADFDLTFYVDNIEDDDTPASAVTFPTFAENFRDQALVNPRGKRTSGVRFKYYF